VFKNTLARQQFILFGDSRRLISLDAFRGAAIAAMILVNNSSFGQETFAPLRHAKWHDWTFADLVFPFFLWIVGHGPGILNPIGNFAQYIDNLLMSGHLYAKVWDPEGLISTLPAISNLLFGTLCGTLLQREGLDAREKTIWMFVWGLALVSLAVFLNFFMPVNKKLWTPPYAFLTSGYAALTFACCYWFIDVSRWKDWRGLLAIYGANPISIYVMSVLFAKLLSLIGVSTLLYRSFFEVIATPKLASLLYAMMHVSMMYLAAWFLYKHRLFLRL
jgi:predicted acyltransferase